MDSLNLSNLKCPYCGKTLKWVSISDMNNINGVVCDSGHLITVIDNQALADINEKLGEFKKYIYKVFGQISANADQRQVNNDEKTSDEVAQMRESINHTKRQLGCQ